MMKHLTFLFIGVMALTPGTKAAVAQQIAVGGGLNAGSIPRALNPLCAAPRRLNGGGLSGTASLSAQRVRVSATVDYLSNGGTTSVADCVPLPPGITVDSSYADAGTSAVSFSGAAWLRVARPFDVGVEAGWVHDHESWFIAPAVGAHVSRVRVEASARLHSISFEEVTRDYDGVTVREVARTDETERAWGFTIRAMFMLGKGLAGQ